MCLARGIFHVWVILALLVPSLAARAQTQTSPAIVQERFVRLMEQAFQATADRVAGDNVRLRTTDRSGGREIRGVFEQIEELAMAQIRRRPVEPDMQAYLRVEALRAGMACVADILTRAPAAIVLFRAIDPDLLINLDTQEYREIQDRYIQENGLRLNERTPDVRRVRAQAYVQGRLLAIAYCNRIGDQVNTSLMGR
jgi:hypothetical protein